jgi:hypothetical protein
MGNVKAYPE